MRAAATPDCPESRKGPCSRAIGSKSRSTRGNVTMQARHTLLSSLGAATFLVIASSTTLRAAPFLIVGNDEKVLWDDKGDTVLSPAGKDSVVILDLANPEAPKIVATLPLKNSVVGPPVNVAIDPTGSIALVANSVDVTKDGDKLKQVPDNKIYVIDLKANPPKLANTVTVGNQPSGLSFNPAGTLALVANRADKSISVLSVKGTDVKVIDTVDMGDIVATSSSRPMASAPRHQVQRAQGGAARCQRRQGHLQQARSADRSVAVQRRRGARWKDRPHGRQWRRRLLRRQRRHGERGRP